MAKSQEFEKMQYVQACDLEADADDDDHYLWSIKHILEHREGKHGIEMKCVFLNGDSSWVDMSAVALQDPIPI